MVVIMPERDEVSLKFSLWKSEALQTYNMTTDQHLLTVKLIQIRTWGFGQGFRFDEAHVGWNRSLQSASS